MKAENCFGKTYAKTTELSSSNRIHKGMDEPPEIKYGSVFKSEFIQHGKIRHETTAEIVGVVRGEDCYQRPIPPSTVNDFYGVPHSERDELVQKSKYDANTAAFFAGAGSQTSGERQRI